MSCCNRGLRLGVVLFGIAVFSIISVVCFNFFESNFIMSKGIVKWFNTTKGYGFILPDDKGADVFVHISAVEASGLKKLNEKDKVSYDITNERGRAAACNIKLI